MAVLAFDLGAGSGRALLGRLTDNRIEAEEIHRFPNDPVAVGERLLWDILRLYHEIKQGLLIAGRRGGDIRSIGIDSWAVDYGLLDANGELIGNPYHYRDSRTDGMMERLLAKVPAEEVFARTGIQFLPFNTIYQLYAMKEADHPALRTARRFLMIPDLIRYFLTGEAANEFSNATTTQLFNPSKGDWDDRLLGAIGIPRDWFGPVLMPGSPAGELRASVRAELGLGAVGVTAVAEHDTGSAVAAVPAAGDSFAYLSCGTWSLLGTEVPEPVLTEEARKLNFTNEGGVNGTYRLLKNIMGLWILEECRRAWKREGRDASHDGLLARAEAARPFAALIDPDDPSFLPPGGMPARVRAYLARTGQPGPPDDGAIVRCVLESLALKYRFVLEQTERLTGRKFDKLHMVGGGIRNRLLCQWTANAIGRPVWAGPVEGSAIGNLAVQWIASGDFADIREARAAIRDSFPVEVYEPDPAAAAAWEEAYGRAVGLWGSGAAE
ncbi:MAG: carbohydrate kinase [Thermobacillus sp. ZCTH02-B1]|uniref:rhamnulokinase n=1 Tax=Thermobacillus sp. ZCTH02-B1 TaxID=1858795 RepID=UPI000B560975|nr:rhamnulokinase family protein [Thermobacillus sp. ZCTH02-B1]OUM93830.1 MAG: carbohydrate kinase [Thermobacillus sp. ZCTH02-B1]